MPDVREIAFGQKRWLDIQVNCDRDASPALQISYQALPVVPELKLTDQGLVDVEMARLLEPATV